jgi:hypothetical protein
MNMPMVSIAPKLIPAAGGTFPAGLPTMVSVAPSAADAGMGLAGGLVAPLLVGALSAGQGGLGEQLREEEMPAELRLKQGLEEKKKRMEVGGRLGEWGPMLRIESAVWKYAYNIT